VQGSMIKINSGGAAGTGSGSAPDAPQAALEAADDEPSPTEPMQPQPPEAYSPHALALIKAAKGGTPFISARLSTAS